MVQTKRSAPCYLHQMTISKDCIEGCVSKDQSSQKELYDITISYLNAICGRYLKNLSDRKDILQEAYILIFEKINQFNPEKGTFKSWSARIVINLCLRHNNRRATFISRPLDSDFDNEGVTPEILDQMTNDELINFLRTMPSKYYEVFNMFIIDAYTHEEIGEILSIKPSLSRKRLARARQWLLNKPKSLNTLLGNYRFSIS